MKRLCLDLATKTGWAIVENGEIVESGVQSFAKKRGESNGLLFLRLKKWLEDIYKLCDGVSLVVYEQAHFRGGAATELCVGMQTHVQSWCADREIECAPVSTSILKKHATGKGNAGKEMMIEVAFKVLGRDPLDDNEADAVCIAMWANDEFGKYQL